MQSDHDLLEEWKGGDRRAGNELFQRHFDALHCFFINKVGGDTEELIQRTVMAAVEGHTRFEGRSAFKTYLLGIANNVLHAHLREKYRSKRWSPTEDSVADHGAGISTLHHKKREQRLLLGALRRIPLEAQTLLELHYWEGLKGRELAEVFGLPENTIWSRIRKAKERLRMAMEELETSKEVLESTMNGLERWAAEVKAGLLEAGLAPTGAGKPSPAT